MLSTSTLTKTGCVLGVGALALFQMRKVVQGYYFDQHFTPTRRLDGRVAIVTGANSGIGLASSVALVGLGSHVILACRSEAKGQLAKEHILSHHPTASKLISILPLDVSSLSSVEQFASSIPPNLDILVNNAGIVKAEKDGEHGVCPIFQTNYLGHFLLTNLVMDKLKESGRSGFPARVVNVSSGRHGKATISWEGTKKSEDPYGQSKLAQIMGGKHLQKLIDREERKEGEEKVKVISLTPGFVKTPVLDKFSKDFSFWKKSLLFLLSPLIYYVSRSPSVGAQVIVMAAAGDNVEGGKHYSNCYEKETTGKDNISNDEKSCERLWVMSKEMIRAEKKARLN